MNPNDDSNKKIASNSTMDPNLTQRVDQILHSLSPEDLSSGLSGATSRLEKLFVGDSSALAPGQMLAFCLAYIKLVPDQASSLNRSAQSLNLHLMVTSYTELATRYLESACSELENGEAKGSMESFLILLQGAYIFARMQEELDDKVQAFVGVPISDVDLMDANLVVHEIIGDQFANRLDKVIATLIQQSKVSKSLIEADLDQTLVVQARQTGSSLGGGSVKSFAQDYGLSLMSGLS